MPPVLSSYSRCPKPWFAFAPCRYSASWLPATQCFSKQHKSGVHLGVVKGCTGQLKGGGGFRVTVHMSPLAQQCLGCGNTCGNTSTHVSARREVVLRAGRLAVKQKWSKNICSFPSGRCSNISVALSHSSYSDFNFFSCIQVKTGSSLCFFHALQPFPSLPEPYQSSQSGGTSVLEVFSPKEAVMLQSHVLCYCTYL